MGLMTGKRGLIMGLANDKSIAWGIAETLRAEGAEIGVTYMGDAMKKRVLPLAEQLNATIVAECDAGDPDSIAALMTQAKDTWGQIDFHRACHWFFRQIRVAWTVYQHVAGQFL